MNGLPKQEQWTKQSLSGRFNPIAFERRDKDLISTVLCQESSRSEELGLKLTDLIYAAGFLDGEGCFGYYVRSARLECNSTYRPALDFLSSLFGGPVKIYKHPPDFKHKQQYNWRLCGVKAVRAMKQLEPYLKEKRNKAIELIKLYESKGKL